MTFRQPTQRELTLLITRKPGVRGGKRAALALTPEEHIAFRENVVGLGQLTKQMRVLIAAQQHSDAEKLLVKTTARWIREERYEPAVAAFELTALAWAAPGKRKRVTDWEKKLVVVLKQHAPKEPLPQLFVRALRESQTNSRLTFDGIRRALMKMRDADIRA